MESSISSQTTLSDCDDREELNYQNSYDEFTDANVESDFSESVDSVNERSADGNLENNIENFEGLSTTLKEIDESLSQENADELGIRITASSEFLKELLLKQKASHRKIQKMQESVQNRRFEVNMLEGEKLESLPDIEDDMSSLGQYIQPVINKELVRGKDKEKEADLAFHVGQQQVIRNEKLDETPLKDDKLMLFFDYMAAHIKKQHLEEERLKLDVIVSLRTKLQDIYEGELIEKIPAKIVQKLNESVYKILCCEVEKVKTDENKKSLRQRQNYENEINLLRKEIEHLSRDRCETKIELKSVREQLARSRESQGRLHDAENRVEYFEELLRSVERENETYKKNVKELEFKNKNLDEKLKETANNLDDSKRRHDSMKSNEETIKTSFKNELEKLMDRNKELNEQLLSLQNKLHEVTADRDQALASKEIDLSIIKHLEQKLKKQEEVLGNVTTASTKNIEKCAQNEYKTKEYKQKLKKCIVVLEASRKEHRELTETLKSVKGECDHYRRALSDCKLNHAEVQLKLSRERTELEEMSSALAVKVKSSYDRIVSLERDNSVLKARLNELQSPSKTTDVLSPNRNFSYTTQDASVQPRTSNASNTKSINRTAPIGNDCVSPSSNTFNLTNTSFFDGGRETSFSICSTPALNSGPVQEDNKTKARNGIGRPYSGEDTRLFLKEMTYKLRNKGNIKTDEAVSSPLQHGHLLKDQVEQIRLQVMDLS